MNISLTNTSLSGLQLIEVSIAYFVFICFMYSHFCAFRLRSHIDFSQLSKEEIGKYARKFFPPTMALTEKGKQLRRRAIFFLSCAFIGFIILYGIVYFTKNK